MAELVLNLIVDRNRSRRAFWERLLKVRTKKKVKLEEEPMMMSSQAPEKAHIQAHFHHLN